MGRSLLFLLWLMATASAAIAQTIDDPAFTVEPVVTGLAQPTGMAFLGADDFLVLEKATGQVRRVLGGVLQPSPVLDVAVDSTGERGLLGIAINGETPPRVFLYYTESDDPAATGTDGGAVLGNRVYRYTWNAAAGVLENPTLLLDLPVTAPATHNGGVLVLGPAPAPGPGLIGDGRILYAVIGDQGLQGRLQNFANGPGPNDAAVIFAIRQDGTPAPGNPFPPYCSLTTTQTCAGDGDCPSGETCETRVARYLAYGIRNSFGLAIDPLTQRLWETENGPASYDEINLITPGMNGGWAQIMGPIGRDVEGIVDLFTMPGLGLTYRDPAFSWTATIAPTAILFPVGSVLGSAYDDVALVADHKNGALYRLPLNATRDGFDFSAFPSLQDLVADGDDGVERDLLRFGAGFGSITDLELGPDGKIYLVRIRDGVIVRIASVAASPSPTPVATSVGASTSTSTQTPAPTPTATPLACAPTPEPCRTPAVHARSYLRLQHDPSGRRNKLVWQWLHGAATSVGELGHPEATDEYALCVYAGGTLIAHASAPAGGRCGAKACWRVGTRSVQYGNRALSPDGLRSLSLRAGADGRAQVLARGDGAKLGLPPLAGLTSPVTVQLKRAAGPCFGAQYSFPPALRSGTGVFRDRAD